MDPFVLENELVKYVITILFPAHGPFRAEERVVAHHDFGQLEKGGARNHRPRVSASAFDGGASDAAR